MAIPDKFFVCIHDYERWYSLLTLEEFDKLSEEERGERYKELSAEDRYFVRLHQAPGAIYSLKKILPKRLWSRLRKKSSFSNPLDGILILALQKNIGENGWKRKKHKKGLGGGKIVATTRRWYDRGIPREIQRLPKSIL